MENKAIKIFDRENNLIGLRYNGITNVYKNQDIVKSLDNLIETIKKMNKNIEKTYRNT